MRNDSLHERWLRDAFHDALRRGLDSKILSSYLDAVLRRERNVYVDFLFQHSWDTTTVYDAFAYGLLRTWFDTGLLAFASAEVGAGPEADREVDANNRILGALPDGFSAKFVPGRGTGTLSDGRFSWSFELRATTYVGGQRMVLLQPEGSAPLEVGYTRSSRTLRHLIEDGALARWPYDSERITTAILTPKGRDTLGCLGVVSCKQARVVELDERPRDGARYVGANGRPVDACADLGLVGATS